MTPLRKRVVRSTQSTVRERGRHRLIIVGLEPGDVISFRLSGMRTTYTLPIDAEFYRAAKLYAAKVRADRAKAKRAVKCVPLI